MTPLSRRLPRELWANLGRYLGMFALLAATIAFVAGFLVAATSIQKIIEDMPGNSALEDGRFTCTAPASPAALAAVESSSDARIYENFSYDLPISGGSIADGSVLRLYKDRDQFDRATLAEGSLPGGDDEVALDRCFCQNNGIGVGDTVIVDGRACKVSGIVTLPDYKALFKKSGDFLFDNVTFCVGVASSDLFSRFSENTTTYTYSFVFSDAGKTDAERTMAETGLVRDLIGQGVPVNGLLDRAANQAIVYPDNDVKGDSTIYEVLFCLIIVIMAFIFVVLTSGTIEEQSSMIGTLLASGYRRGELLRHNLAIPLVVSVAAAFTGNLLGYLFFVQPLRELYYRSYSLPPFQMHWNWGVFLFTTGLPLILLMGITGVMLARRLGYTPLDFLRHETSRRHLWHSVHLPSGLKFTTRFRLRIFLRNIPVFATMFLGISFASLLLYLGMCMMPTVDHYVDDMAGQLVSDHRYLLASMCDVDAAGEAIDPAAERFAERSVQVQRSVGRGLEDVVVYGIQDDSAYWHGYEVGVGKVIVGEGLAEKCAASPGETIRLESPYTDDVYQAEVTGVRDAESDTNIYMSIEDFNSMFGNPEGYYNGYVSDKAITFPDGVMVGDLTADQMTGIGTQMSASMGSIARSITIFSAVIYLIIMYLLTKSVLERSVRGIALMKVFGYRDREVDRLYIRTITFTTVLSLVVCLVPLNLLAGYLMHAMMMDYSGWLVLYVPPMVQMEIVGIGVAVYGLVAILLLRQIRHVPAAEALKIQE